MGYKEAKQNTDKEQGIYGGDLNRNTITVITNSSEGINPSATIPRLQRRFVRKHGVSIGGSPKMARGTNHNGVGKLIGISENSLIHSSKENIPTGPKSIRNRRISRNINSSHSHERSASLGLNHNVHTIIDSPSSHHESIGFNGAMDTRIHETSTCGRRRSGSYNFHIGKGRRASNYSGESMKDVPWMDNWRHEHTSFGKFLNDPSDRSFRTNSTDTVASSNTTGDNTMEAKAPKASHESIDQKHNMPDTYEFGTGPNPALDPLMDLSVLLPCDTPNHLSGVPATSKYSGPSSVNNELLASSNDSIINWYASTKSGSDLDSNQQLLTPNCTPPPSPPTYAVEGIKTRRNGTFVTVDLDKLVEFKPYENGRERNHRFESSILGLSSPYNQYLWLSKKQKYLVRGKHVINHIDPSNEVCQRLESLLVSKAVLEAKGYEAMAAKELEKHRRCRNCHGKKTPLQKGDSSLISHSEEIQMDEEQEWGACAVPWACGSASTVWGKQRWISQRVLY